MARRQEWYKTAAVTGVRVRPVTEIPGNIPDVRSEVFDCNGKRLLVSHRRGFWQGVLYETRQSVYILHGQSKAAILEAFGVEDATDRLADVLAALGKAA